MKQTTIVLVAALCIATPLVAEQKSSDKKPVAKQAYTAAAVASAPAVSAKVTDSAKPADYSREPFVVERVVTTERFENDGTKRQQVMARIKVQDESGVKQLGQLVWGYNSGNERMDVGYVRVRKADGTVVTAGQDAVQDLSAPVSREAPMYTDYRQKHVTVPGLRPGETLEYEYTLTLHTPLAPGQFWTEYNFSDDGIVLDEQLEISVPAGKVLKLKTKPGRDAKVTNEGDRRIYRWTSSHLTRDDEDDDTTKKKKRKPKTDEELRPDVQLSTFASWEEVGSWYAQLERERRMATPELQRKANALIAGRASEMERVEALYDYVAKNFRYVSLSFGMGRYQPHAAAEVFGNQYGDCKDKNTLLAAMLSAAGIKSNSVLINSSRKIDPDVPSPAQFDHVITQVPLGTEVVWLDTTTEVAPFRLLMFPLRNKQALVVSQEGASKLDQTPVDPPFPNMQRLESSGQISELGKLTLKVKETLRGDMEVAARMVLRRLPETRWKDMLQYGANVNGMQGEISDYKVSDPAATREPMQVEYTISQPSYLDWTDKKTRLRLPITEIWMPEFDEDSGDPLKLNVKLNSDQHLELEFPPKFTVKAPISMSVKRDYGEYSSNYKVDGQKLIVDRRIKLTVSELPLARLSDYQAFRRAVMSDTAQRVGVESAVAGGSEIPNNAKADEIYEAANSAYDQRQYSLAAELYNRVVVLEPKHKFAWNNLGRTYLAMNEYSRALVALKKAIEVNPYDEWAYNNLGRVYWRQRNYKDAAEAFQKQIEVNPLDQYSHRNLGEMYLEMKKYVEAIPELEKAASIAPDNAMLQIEMGRAYLNGGDREKGLAAFDRAIELAAVPPIWNGVAYEMAQSNVELDRALQYAESAVSSTTTVLRNMSPSAPQMQQQGMVASLAASWDTLGWVYFRKGDMAKARAYIEASWELSQHGEVGDHLGQIYEKLGDKEKAIHTYKLALAASNAIPDTRERLASLIGGEKGVDAAVNSVREELSQLRTVKMGPLVKEDASAEFNIVLAAGTGETGSGGGAKAEVEAVRFVSGADALKPMAEKLRSMEHHFSFPDATPTRIMRRGILSCSKTTGGCTFVFLTTDAGFSNTGEMPDRVSE